METPEMAGEGRGVGSGVERLVIDPSGSPLAEAAADAPRAPRFSWMDDELRERVPNPYNAEWPDTIINTRTREVVEAVPAHTFRPGPIGERAVLEERRSFAFFDGERWTFGPVSVEEERAWVELEQRLARLSE